MMQSDFALQIRLEGVADMIEALKAAPEEIRVKAVRQALRAAGRVIRDDAKAHAPVLQGKAPYRKPGTVRDRISVRLSKFAREAGDEGVFVNVKPLRGKVDTRKYGKASAKNPNDPYYWRFLEFKTRYPGQKARPFLGPAAKSKAGEAVQRFMREAVPAIEKINRKNLKKTGSK